MSSERGRPDPAGASPRSHVRPRRPIGTWPRVAAGAVAAVMLLAAAGTLLLGAAFPARAEGTMPGTAAMLALATTAATPSPTATASPVPTASATATPLPMTTPTGITPPEDLTGYVWPLDRARVTLPFGPSPLGEMVVQGQLFHDGLDISTGCGDKVLAAHDGVVLAASRHYDEFVGWIGDLQPYFNWLTATRSWPTVPIVIVIDDGNGYRSIYAHEASVSVTVGEHVTAGQVIGIEGMTGLATGCHVHYSLYSPDDTLTFALNAGVIKRDHMPAAEIARVNPLLVLPMRCNVEEQVALRPYDAAQVCHTAPFSTQVPQYQ